MSWIIDVHKFVSLWHGKASFFTLPTSIQNVLQTPFEWSPYFINFVHMAVRSLRSTPQPHKIRYIINIINVRLLNKLTLKFFITYAFFNRHYKDMSYHIILLLKYILPFLHPPHKPFVNLSGTVLLFVLIFCFYQMFRQYICHNR